MAEGFVSHADEVKNSVSQKVRRAATIIRGMMESNAKKEITKVVYDTPERGYVRTGNLRNSLTAKVTEDDGVTCVVAGTNVEYAPYVELGTYKMEARPYLRPAVENHGAEYRRVLESELGGLEGGITSVL